MADAQDVLCLASGGGQQGRILAAVGANVTVFDNSPSQLKQDQLVAEREALTLRTVDGDAADLSIFADETFDLIFNPVSTVFMPDVRVVWKECHRVLRRGGILMTGSMNPVHYIFDLYKADTRDWKEEMIYKNTDGYDLYGGTRDRSIITLVKSVTTSISQIFLYDRKTGKITEVSEPDECAF